MSIWQMAVFQSAFSSAGCQAKELRPANAVDLAAVATRARESMARLFGGHLEADLEGLPAQDPSR